MPADRWTNADFDQLSWHDNHLHGFTVREGEQALGELALDIDFILEWLCDKDSGSCEFRIAPATLTFHEVSDLVVALDYVTTTAALCPASIGEITRESRADPSGYRTFNWRIDINWPAGCIRFIASGFSQILRAAPIVVPQQYLSPGQRLSVSD